MWCTAKYNQASRNESVTGGLEDWRESLDVALNRVQPVDEGITTGISSIGDPTYTREEIKPDRSKDAVHNDDVLMKVSWAHAKYQASIDWTVKQSVHIEEKYNIHMSI